MSQPIDRRQFLRVSTGGLVVAAAACSSDSDGGASTPTAATDPASTTTTATATTTATTSTTAATGTTTTEVVAEVVDPAASALLAPGSSGLIDEATFQARADEYLTFATTDIDEIGGPTAVAAHLARARRDPDFVRPWHWLRCAPANRSSPTSRV